MDVLEENPLKRSFDEMDKYITNFTINDLYNIIISGNFEEFQRISADELKYTILPNGFRPYMLIIYLYKLFQGKKEYEKMVSYITNNYSIKLTQLEISLINRAYMLSILMISIELNHREIFPRINKYDYSVYNDLDIIRDMTPLMCAVKCNNIKAIIYLIEYIGVDLYSFNSKGKTAFHIANESDNKDIIKYLMTK